MKHKLVSRETPSGEKYLEMRRERGAVLATKNHQGGRVKLQNIRKTWLKTLPGETNREIPVTSES